MDKIEFTGRVAIITGAGAGLGKDYAIQLAKRGASVVVNDVGGARDGMGNSRAAADNVVEEIRAFGGKAVPSYANVGTVEGGASIVGTAIDAFGKVDILVNNAGIIRDKSFVKMKEEDWDAVLNVHLKGAYCVTRPAFENMRSNGYGRIVMTSSGSGLLGNFGQANYAAAKIGIVGLANVLKLEGKKYGIKVNTVAPNAGTRMSEGVMPSEIFGLLKPEHVTPVVLYLASKQCRDSGLCINAFGGYVSRSAILTGNGITGIKKPEDVLEKWDRIINMKTLKFYDTMSDMVATILPNILTD